MAQRNKREYFAGIVNCNNKNSNCFCWPFIYSCRHHQPFKRFLLLLFVIFNCLRSPKKHITQNKIEDERKHKLNANEKENVAHCRLALFVLRMFVVLSVVVASCIYLCWQLLLMLLTLFSFFCFFLLSLLLWYELSLETFEKFLLKPCSSCYWIRKATVATLRQQQK